MERDQYQHYWPITEIQWKRHDHSYCRSIYQDEIWKLYSYPRTILSDRGPQFTSRFIEDLAKALGTKWMLLTVYHPQTNGQIEQINQEIGTFLRHYVNYQQDNWMEWLVVAKFQYNDKKYTVIGYIPFGLNFGWYPWKGDLTVQTEFPKLEEFLISLQKSWKEAIKAMDMAKETMKRQFDKKRQNLQGLKEEDNIWLKAKNIHSNRLLKKLGQKRYGPFKVLKAIG